MLPFGTDKEGSVTVIGAVSPPGGDFSEPVTQNTLRVTKTFWALDAKLAQRRHFPSINWLQSYSLYRDTLSEWFTKNVASDWASLVGQSMSILQEEEKLQEIVQLVGSDALPEKERVTLEVARLLREFFLQQNAFHDVDTYCDLKKTHLMLKTILMYQNMAKQALDAGVPAVDVLEMQSKNRIAEVKFERDYKKLLSSIEADMKKEFSKLK